MGEIRINVRLTNAMDEALARRGKLQPEQIRTYDADAMVDTGAVRSVIPVHVMEKLGIEQRGERVAEYADGRNETVPVTEPIIFELLGRDAVRSARRSGSCRGQSVKPRPRDSVCRERALRLTVRFEVFKSVVREISFGAKPGCRPSVAG